jgi:hypothetical protein
MFAFYNLHEGDFNLTLDPNSLPENGQLRTPESVPVVLRLGVAVPSVEFRFAIQNNDKPIRKVLDRR